MAITPNTIAEKLVSINNSKADIASAITEKGGTVPQLFSGYGDAIRALPSDSLFPCEIEDLPVEDYDATFALFFNLDGQVVDCISKDEVRALTELPEVPDESESGLVNGSWNWTLEQLKAAEHPVSVGPQYDTEDDNTWIKIETEEDNQEFSFSLGTATHTNWVVDWGDGTTTQNPPETCTHTYVSKGAYTIKIDSNKTRWSAEMQGLTFSLENRNCVCEFYHGRYFNRQQQRAITWCPNLRRISLYNTITGVSNTFYGPYACNSSIKQITVPRGCTNYTNGSSSNFQDCVNLRVICLPGTITGTASPGLQNLYNLRLWRNQARENLTFSTYNNLLTFELVDSNSVPAFNTSISLRKLVFPKNRTTTITTIPANFLIRCYCLQELENFPWNTITTIGGSAFYYCMMLNFPRVLELPALTSISGATAFTSCLELYEIVLGTAGNTITMGGNQTFQTANSLRKATFLSQPNTIPAQTFSRCSSLELVDFRTCTSVPTLANVNAFEYDTNAKIVVPDSLYDTWIAATNWSNLSGQIVKASEYQD